MAEAAEADTNARKSKPPKPAMHKLKMLPEVVSLLNRNHLQQTLVDPECSILRSVRFFLEPLDDGSLPAYNIQREMFAILAKLPIGKEVLIASGIGKVTLFYTKSKRPELGIRRQAEKLLGEWTRPILKRSDDYRQREYVHAEYDPTYASILKMLQFYPSISPSVLTVSLENSPFAPRPVQLRKPRPQLKLVSGLWLHLFVMPTEQGSRAARPVTVSYQGTHPSVRAYMPDR